MHCPLCFSNHTHHFFQEPKPRSLASSVRDFYRCTNCDLIFVPPAQFLSPAEEKAYYDLHQNNAGDVGYREFLGKLFKPMVALLKPEDHGLDYGSGPGPTLSLMFEEQTFSMNVYDYIYANDDTVLTHTYNFVTSTETIEHFRRPRADLLTMWQLIKAGGYLGVMTGIVNEQTDFASWHYKNDPTHVCFYSRTTINWLANLFQARQVYENGNVTILQKITELKEI